MIRINHCIYGALLASANQGAYAVFDMDNTSYQFDIEESLLPYLEMKGLKRRTRARPR